MSMFTVTDASQVFQLTDAAAEKVQSLIAAEDAPVSSRCASPFAPVGARASATRCSSTPTSPRTTTRSSTVA